MKKEKKESIGPKTGPTWKQVEEHWRVYLADGEITQKKDAEAKLWEAAVQDCISIAVRKGVRYTARMHFALDSNGNDRKHLEDYAMSVVMSLLAKKGGVDGVLAKYLEESRTAGLRTWMSAVLENKIKDRLRRQGRDQGWRKKSTGGVEIKSESKAPIAEDQAPKPQAEEDGDSSVETSIQHHTTPEFMSIDVYGDDDHIQNERATEDSNIMDDRNMVRILIKKANLDEKALEALSYYMADWSTKDAAEEMKISEGSYKEQIAKIFRKFRKAYKEIQAAEAKAALASEEHPTRVQRG